MSETLHLSVDPSPSDLERIADEVTSLGERENWPVAMTYRVQLVLEELVLNIINHGFDSSDSGSRLIEVNLNSGPESLTIGLLDNGRPFDPLSDAPDPDTGAAMEDRPIGGLGVHLVKTMMDELHYRREDGMNHLTLVAHRSE